MRLIWRAWIALLLVLGVAQHLSAGAIYKCKAQGVTTYQSNPCPPTEPLQRPTLAQLNAERQKMLREQSQVKANDVTVRAAAPATVATSPVPVAAVSGVPAPAFQCDGRTRCSQMRSCAEANYFLSHCPDVKMDGDGDGVPCEEQWCGPR